MSGMSKPLPSSTPAHIVEAYDHWQSVKDEKDPHRAPRLHLAYLAYIVSRNQWLDSLSDAERDAYLAETFK